jgi:RNA polymerase sigma-70 factor, ECF subfamily
MAPSRNDPLDTADPKSSTFSAFYQEHNMELLRFAWHYGAPHLDLEAIVAEAWARAWATWPSLARPRPWLYRVIINLIHDAGKTAQQTRPASEPLDDGECAPAWSSAVPMPGAEWAARVSEVSLALQRLPAQQRAAVLLDYQGFSRPEIAAALGCSRTTVRGHLHRGRAHLKTMLGEPVHAGREERSTGLEGRPA